MQRDISVFKNKTFNGDCKVILSKMPDNSVDSIVTDPPYELKFMNKGWDGSGIAYDVDMWKECLRVLKPGGHLLSFGGSRTYHRMACAIEDAGFEIRDGIVELLSTDTAVMNFLESLNQAQVEAFLRVMEESQFGGIIEWIYGSGFPKSQNIGKAIDKMQGNKREVGKYRTDGRGKWELKMNREQGDTGIGHADGSKQRYYESVGSSEFEGMGTALKPSHEPIVLARKPLSEKTIAANVLKWGTGGINIDGCRVEYTGKTDPRTFGGKWKTDKAAQNVYEGGYEGTDQTVSQQGRFPANIILDGSDEVVKGFPQSKSTGGSGEASQKTAPNSIYGKYKEGHISANLGGLGDSGSAARFFKNCEGEDLCENVNIVEQGLILQKQVEDFVLRLVAIEAHPEGKRLKDTIAPFMSEMRKQLKNNTENDMPMMKNIGEKCLQGLRHIITERLQENPANYAEIQKLTSTMMIIQNLLSIDGFVGVVISDTILRNMVLGGKVYQERFKYCAKASKVERNLGLTDKEEVVVDDGRQKSIDNPFQRGKTLRKNDHPTVKPLKLMSYLVRLITPPGGIVLDPFSGSGSTLLGAKQEGFNYIGIELQKGYVEIANCRLCAVEFGENILGKEEQLKIETD